MLFYIHMYNFNFSPFQWWYAWYTTRHAAGQHQATLHVWKVSDAPITKGTFSQQLCGKLYGRNLLSRKLNMKW